MIEDWDDFIDDSKVVGVVNNSLTCGVKAVYFFPEPYIIINNRVAGKGLGCKTGFRVQNNTREQEKRDNPHAEQSRKNQVNLFEKDLPLHCRFCFSI